MSIVPAKTKQNLKKTMNIAQNEQGVQTHQKTHEHTSKNTKR